MEHVIAEDMNTSTNLKINKLQTKIRSIGCSGGQKMRTNILLLVEIRFLDDYEKGSVKTHMRGRFL